MSKLEQIAAELRSIAEELEHVLQTQEPSVEEIADQVAARELTRMAQEDEMAYTAEEIAPVVAEDGNTCVTIPAPPMKTTWMKVASAFRHRYRQKMGIEWHDVPHRGHLEEIAQWLDTMDEPAKAGKILLDNWFATEWAANVDYKPRFLNENITGIYRSPQSRAEQQGQEAARNAENARIRHEIARARAEANDAAKAGRAPSVVDLDLSIPEVRALVGRP